MTDKDRLIEKIEKSFAEQYEKRGLLTAPHTADDLLANGVFILPEDLRGTQDFSISAFIEAMQMYKEKDRYIKPPCKVGAEIFGLFDNDDEQRKEIYEGKVLCYSLDENNLLWAIMRYKNGLTYWHTIDDFGETVFLTKEEAEEKLKELGK